MGLRWKEWYAALENTRGTSISTRIRHDIHRIDLRNKKESAIWTTERRTWFLPERWVRRATSAHGRRSNRVWNECSVLCTRVRVHGPRERKRKRKVRRKEKVHQRFARSRSNMRPTARFAMRVNRGFVWSIESCCGVALTRHTHRSRTHTWCATPAATR